MSEAAKRVYECRRFDSSVSYKPVSEVIEFLQEFLDKFEYVEEPTFCLTTENSYGDELPIIEISWWRLERPEEAVKRIAKEAELKRLTEARERALYEELKRKLGE